MIEKAKFRDAMAHLPAAVNVLTSDGLGGQAGLTATAVSSVTDAPGTLLVCINRSSRAHEVFLKNGVFCVNTLASDQQELADIFAAGLDMAARFLSGSWYRLVTGSPVLAGAAIAFDCKISATSEIGTHTVIFGDVQTISQAAVPTGLLYFGRSYHRLGLS